MSISEVELGEEITVKAVKPLYPPKPNYAALGDKGMIHHKKTNTYMFGFDPIPIFKILSQSATWLWWELVDIRNIDTNVSILRGKNQDPYQKQKISKAYKELASYSLVHRYKREHYLINPSAMLPKFDNFVAVSDKWESYLNVKSYPKNPVLNSAKLKSASISPKGIKPRRLI